MDVEEVIEALVEDITNLKKENKAIKRRLQKLANAHDALTNKNEQQIIEIQRLAAATKVNKDCDALISILDHQLPKKGGLRTQLIAEASSCKSHISASNSPLQLAVDFAHKWTELLNNLGADVITY